LCGEVRSNRASFNIKIEQEFCEIFPKIIIENFLKIYKKNLRVDIKRGWLFVK